MEYSFKFNPAQYEVLNALSCLQSEEDVKALKSVIVQFLNARLQNEMERLWQDGTLNEEIVAGWQGEHMRTPYRTAHEPLHRS